MGKLPVIIDADPGIGSAPPANPVPPPRGTRAISAARQALTTRETCSVSAGRATQMIPSSTRWALS